LTRSLRLCASAAVGCFALVFAGTAFAAYNPSLLVAGTNHSLSRSAPVVIGLDRDDNDDATGEVTFYSPRSYRVTLGQAPGIELGGISGQYQIGARGGAVVDIEGKIKTDNAANYVTNTCSPGAHEAVWVLEFTVEGNPMRIPIYVDRVTTGPEAAYASARMKLCLASPYLPPPQGAPSGASLLVAAFSVRSVFTNPSARASYAWNAIFTPYTPGSATLNPTLTAQSTSFVRLPVGFSVSAKRQRRGKTTFALVTACLKEGGAGIRGVSVQILGGRTARGAKRVAGGRTNARGCATARVRVRTKTMVIAAFADVPPRQASNCQPVIVARCSRPSVAPLFDLLSATAVRVRR
jgi:hypothetical protein